MSFTLEQLRGFVAVADELHFGRAAARLQMTQPPLSRQIQRLEKEVGAQLLERDHRKVVLTAAGEAFLAEAHRLLALADTAPLLARRVSAGSAGLLRIGFTAVAAYGPLGELMATLNRRLPGLNVGLHEMVSRAQVIALLNAEIDLGLGRPPVDPEVFGSRLLHRERLLVALPVGHRLAGRSRVHGDDVAGERVVMHSPAQARYFHDLVVAAVPIARTEIVHSVSQVLTMVWLVSAGRGIAFVPGSAARLGVPGVEFVPLETRVTEPVELHLLWSLESRNPALWKALELLGAPG